MSVRSEITEYDGIYFVTITCSGWRHLFHLSDGHAEVYKWFDHLKGQGHFVFAELPVSGTLRDNDQLGLAREKQRARFKP